MAGNRRLTILLGVCVGILLLAFFAMIVYPKYTELSDEADKATKAKNEATAKRKAAEKLDPEEIEASLANLQAKVPSSLELPNLINRIQELAQAQNLVWIQGDPEDVSVVQETTNGAAPGQEATQAPQLETYDFSIVIRGSMADLLKFIQGMTDESIGRIIVVTALDVQFNAEDGPDAIEATLKLEIKGWKDGGSIDPSGCIEEEGSTTPTDQQDNPNCNRTNVETSDTES
jgi:Tfp pilus assembly protein PilO